MTTRIDTVLLTGKTHTTAGIGRERLDLQLSSPAGKEIALVGVQAHPTAEQLFAGAWSACYTGALGLAAKARQVTLPADLSVDVEVDLGMKAEAYLLQARFAIRAPGLARELVEELAHAAHQICPYSKAVHGNIDVAVDVLAA